MAKVDVSKNRFPEGEKTLLNRSAIQSEIFALQQELLTAQLNKLNKEKKLNIDERIARVNESINQLSLKELSDKERKLLKEQVLGIDATLQQTTNKHLASLKANIAEEYPTLADRPPDVQKNIEKSAKEIELIAQGNDQNPIAHWIQQGIKKLLS